MTGIDTGEVERPYSNDAIWAAFYRDGKSMGEIVDQFDLRSVYDLSPWLTVPLLNTVPFEKYTERVERLEAEKTALREKLEAARRENHDVLKDYRKAVSRAERAEAAAWEALRAAFIAGALAVHQEWVQAHQGGDGPGRVAPEFGEAADDYVARAALEDRK